MKADALAVVSVTFLLSSVALGQQAKLEGYVADDGSVPVQNVRIVVPGGQADFTDSKGHFTISFPASVLPGQATRIDIEKPGWVVFEPLLGNCVVQSSARNYEPLKVVIVPKGSPLALGPKRLGQVIRQWSDERVKLRSQVAEAKSQLDEYAFLREYSDKYGFTLDQFLAAAKQWAQTKESDDKEEQALKEYFLKNYDIAAQLAHEAGAAADQELERANQSKKEASLKVIRRYELEGNARYAESKFREALAAYKEIDNRFLSKKLSKEELTLDWAEVKLLLGNAQAELGTRVEGTESKALLAESLKSYGQALTVYSRDQFPQDWADTQNNLGNALRNQGERASGEESVRLLGQAVGAFREALKVCTREQFPQEWAATQANLGSALSNQGERASGEESVRLLRQAVEVYREALKVYTREQFSQQWGTTQNNLGNALLYQGQRASGEESSRLMAQAVEAYREALKVRTREQLPQDWAMTQNNLGNALQRQGERASGEESVRLLGQAVGAYREALKVRTREQFPQQWAGTQNNLGNALLDQGERTNGEESSRLMAQTVEAYREALKVYTREQLPQDWAMAQNNLGNALLYQGERASGEESVRLLGQAVEAFREALKVRTRELPQDWATVQNNLGNALSIQGERASGEESVRLLEQAVGAYRGALKVCTRDRLPQQWAATQNNLGNALSNQGQRASQEQGARLLRQAMEAYREALKVYTREQFPQQWATTQNNLGNALSNQGQRASEEQGARLLEQAVEAYHQALTIYTKEQFPWQWATIQRSMGQAFGLLHRWPEAADACVAVLQVDPDDKGAYGLGILLYREITFRFRDAFDLNRAWLARHPADPSARANLAENFFTIALFSEFEEQLKTLIASKQLEQRAIIALQTVGVANLLALGRGDEARARLDAVIGQVEHQGPQFKVEWSFASVRHFCTENERLTRYRGWLGELFDAAENESRDAILAALKEVRAKFKA